MSSLPCNRRAGSSSAAPRPELAWLRSHSLLGRVERLLRRQALLSRGALPKLHFAPKAKRVIYLLQSGAPSHIDLFDYKPKLQEHRGQDLPDSIRHGAAAHGHDLRAEDVSRSPDEVSSSRQHGKSGTWLSELLPHTAKIADEICLVKIAAHRGDQPRPGDHVYPDRQRAARAAEHGLLAHLRPRQREPEPAGVRRHDLAGTGKPTDQPLLRPALGQRLSADELSGRASSAPRATRCCTSTIRRASTPPAAARCSTTSPS